PPFPTRRSSDLGLAKLTGAPEKSSPSGPMGDPAQSPTFLPTMSPAMTAIGVVLGTAAYMSPEQAKGRPADKRSDVWAFGCVLYEMLTGKRAFDGDDVTETLASVLKSEPDWTRLAHVPPSIRALVEGCLRKDRRERIGDVSVARFLLTQPIAASADHRSSSLTPFSWTRAMPWFASIVLLAALIGTIAWRPRSAEPGAVTRFAIPIPPDQVWSNAISPLIAISHEG